MQRLDSHRYDWLVTFILSSCKDIDELVDQRRFTRFDRQVLKRFLQQNAKKKLLNLPTATSNWRIYFANQLYVFFKVCRKLSLNDQYIICENFKNTRIMQW